jgi:hypothetical protein
MSAGRIALIVFWVVLGAVLFKQFFDYNQHLASAPAAAPQHFFYDMANAPTTAAAAVAPPLHAADVRQESYAAVINPDTSACTSTVMIKNYGNARATGIECEVRPYRGAVVGQDELGRQVMHKLSDGNALAQISQWITFPDLDPGEESTQTVSFFGQPGVRPGSNPDPQIIFQTAKSNP